MADLSIRDLTIEYSSGGYAVRPIDGLDLEVSAGSLVLLLGPSGCGKTTLLSCLGGILSPTSGSIRFGDVDVTGLEGAALTRYRRGTVGIVFQAFNLVPSLSALDNVIVPLRAAGRSRGEATARATELLGRFGLSERTHHLPGDLSGGQQQRVAIARALALDPPLIIADEPTAHLDHIQVEEVIRALRELASDDRIVVVSTHDQRLLPLADRVVELAPLAPVSTRAPEVVELAAGAVLFRQGDVGDLIYVVESGEVEIVGETVGGGEVPLDVVGPTRWFGEFAVLFGLPRSATARARTAVRLTGYGAQEFRTRVSGGGSLATPTTSPRRRRAPLRAEGRPPSANGHRRESEPA